jgi:hypothetical protein
MSIEWFGHTQKSDCSLQLSAYHWGRKKYVRWGDPFAISDGSDQVANHFRDDAGKFVNGNGKLRTKVTCSDATDFQLRTDRIQIVA